MNAKTVKVYCPYCKEAHNLIETEYMAKEFFKGAMIEYKKKDFYCPICKDIFYSEEFEKENEKNMNYAKGKRIWEREHLKK